MRIQPSYGLLFAAVLGLTLGFNADDDHLPIVVRVAGVLAKFALLEFILERAYQFCTFSLVSFIIE